jgi:two-component system sensor histidine kinase PilS (NtrC family)
MMIDETLLKRQKALIGFRVLFVTVLLGSLFVFQIGYRTFPHSYSVLYLIIGMYSLSIGYSLLLGRVPAVPLAYAQLVLDVVAATGLILITGGIESWFSWLLLLIVVASAMVISRKAGYVIATLGGILYGTLLDLQYFGILRIPFDPNLQAKDFFYKIFSHFFGLYLIAYLTGELSERLARKDSDLADLTLFNREVIENTPSGLLTTDAAGTIILFNKAAEDITGLAREDAVGRSLRSVFPIVKSLHVIRRSEASVTLQGRKKIIGLSISAIPDIKNGEKGFIVIFQDLTEMKRMSEEIKRKEKLAAVGELSGKIAHEIKNPLASLKGSMEMLRESNLEEEQKERLMRIAVKEMDRLNGILNDFLSYSKPRSLEFERFDLHEALSETLEMLNNRGAVGVTFHTGFQDPLPVNADEQRLQQVFWNLGINAIDAMPEGGELQVNTSVANGGVEIRFKDTGSGISKDVLSNIFFPFFTTKRNGTGLGLSIAYRVVEDHGGSIAVESRPGEGTEFTITLPRN